MAPIRRLHLLEAERNQLRMENVPQTQMHRLFPRQKPNGNFVTVRCVYPGDIIIENARATRVEIYLRIYTKIIDMLDLEKCNQYGVLAFLSIPWPPSLVVFGGECLLTKVCD